jgi:hypothetical protein
MYVASASKPDAATSAIGAAAGAAIGAAATGSAAGAGAGVAMVAMPTLFPTQGCPARQTWREGRMLSAAVCALMPPAAKRLSAATANIFLNINCAPLADFLARIIAVLATTGE